MAILIVGVIQLMWVSFDEPEKDHLPILPLDPRIWIVVIIVGIFGVIQQLCVIGEKYKKNYTEILHKARTGFFLCTNFHRERPVFITGNPSSHFREPVFITRISL